MTQQKRQFALGGVAVVLLGTAAIVWFVRGSAKAEFATTHDERAVDITTGEEFTIHARNDQAAPYANPKTGQRSVYPWYYCEKCEKRVIPPLQTGRDGLAVIPMGACCPVCNGAVAPWVPEFPEQAHPKGDAPFPKLP